jgi:hypothetical protein
MFYLQSAHQTEFPAISNSIVAEDQHLLIDF